MKFLLTTAIAIVSAVGCLTAQTTPEEVFATIEKSGGVYYPYPVTESVNTPAPKGYKPFYISHYGRHGSRYLISDNDYVWVLELLQKADTAGALTPLGHDVLDRVSIMWEEAEGRGGELTPLGTRQHRGIATRMYEAFPEVFAGDAQMTARSTVIMRCAASMNAFVEALKERRPELVVPRESSQRHMGYLNYHSPQSNEFTSSRGPWQEMYRKFEQQQTQPDRLVESLFNSPEYVYRNINPHALMWGLYWLASDAPNMETSVRLHDIFTPQELFDLWQAFNFRFYVCDSNYPGNHHMLLDNAKPLLRNIIASADSIIVSGGNGADLRFGHDGNLIPLTGLMRFTDCYNQEEQPERFYTAFTDFHISPMAGNMQMIFFRDKGGDVIVKFMLNEREIAIPVETDKFPFYDWDDVKAFYQTILDAPNYNER